MATVFHNFFPFLFLNLFFTQDQKPCPGRVAQLVGASSRMHTRTKGRGFDSSFQRCVDISYQLPHSLHSCGFLSFLLLYCYLVKFQEGEEININIPLLIRSLCIQSSLGFVHYRGGNGMHRR